MSLDPPSAEDSIFTSIDVAVEQAADSVCSEGLLVEVENDDGRGAEERRVARFLQKGCHCKLNAGNPVWLRSPRHVTSASWSGRKMVVPSCLPEIGLGSSPHTSAAWMVSSSTIISASSGTIQG